MINRVVITGSGGMLGSTLLEKLKNEKRFKIIAVTSQVEKLSKLYKGYDNISIVDSLDMINGDDSSICVNCAFPRTQNGETLAKAMFTTEKLINELMLKNCEYIINISSQSVYAQNGDYIKNEEDIVAPSNLYGITKLAIEQIVRLICTKYNMNYVNIRLGSLAGDKFDQRMINRFYYKILDGDDIYIDKGTPKVSYLHLEDAGSALVRLIDYIRKDNKIDNLYNLSNNDWLLIKDLASISIEKARQLNSEICDIQIKYTDKKSNYNNVINSSKFYKDFNWQPCYTMEKIVWDVYNKKKGEVL